MNSVDGVSLVIGDICKRDIRFLLEKRKNSLLPYSPYCFSTVFGDITEEDKQLFEKIKKKYGLITTDMFYRLVGLRILIQKELIIIQQRKEEETNNPQEQIHNIDQFQLCLFLHSMHECGEYSFFSEKINKQIVIKQYFFTPPYSVKIKKRNTKWFNFNKLSKKINNLNIHLDPLSNLFFEIFYDRKFNLFETIKRLEYKEEKSKINPSLWLFKHKSPIVPPDNYINTFVVGNKYKYIIDPGADSKKEMIKSGFLDFIENHVTEIDGILLSHGHLDHCNQIDFLRKNYGIPVFSSKNTAKKLLEKTNFKINGFLNDNQLIDLGNSPFSKKRWYLKVINLNGHTKGSIGFLDMNRGFLFSGDFILEGRQTIVDPNYGSLVDLRRNIKKLLKLNITFIHPGHGDIFKFDRKWVKTNLTLLDNQEEKIKESIESGYSSIEEITKHVFSDSTAHIGRFLTLAHIQHLEEKNVVIKRGEDYFLNK
ncbi:MAG: MBL fold metallo-hydrolase [Candidatus Heimdallarchaeum aukensis]|uniref:MBL fold metallo-hydrolase n=1 Tax=Candidatus Heimdallarchaeum aukensis TaxID=2876573 RepID=A0A9Y1BMJ0_9ARCH|nr:MAG: MBL fold metallo-hydrolase [Candidatus Heimdallarchaeum aukensis]